MSLPFEQQTAVAVRNLSVFCVILAVGLVLSIGVAVWGFVNASSATHQVAGVAAQVKDGLVQQTANRTSNVAQWCGAINRLDGTLTAYVSQFRHAPRLDLRQLDCKQLERKTLASTRTHR